ncbi:MAG: hypothetical protein K0T01_2321, partial [Acidimicrobiia bacterium]|nr:hypothetical protein [Acidimicrobiia bacterium]
MGPETDDNAILQNKDLVCVGNRRHPLGDDHHRGISGVGLERPTEPGIRGQVEGGERVVE